MPGSYSGNTDHFLPRISFSLLAPLLFKQLSQPVLCLKKGIGQWIAEGELSLLPYELQKPGPLKNGKDLQFFHWVKMWAAML